MAPLDETQQRMVRLTAVGMTTRTIAELEGVTHARISQRMTRIAEASVRRRDALERAA